MRIQDQLLKACYDGDITFVKENIDKEDPGTATFGFMCACWGGRIDIVEFLSELGFTDWDAGLKLACEQNHRKVIDYIIEKCTQDKRTWDYGLFGACEGGHLALVNRMIEMGATDWGWGLRGACKGGHLHLAKDMIEKGADLDKGLEGAYAGKHYDIKIFNLLIKSGPTNIFLFMHFASETTNKKFIAQVLMTCFDRKQRQEFLQLLRKNTKYNHNAHLYLSNRHLIRHCTTNYVHQARLRNVLQCFVCIDIATWSCRFIGK